MTNPMSPMYPDEVQAVLKSLEEHAETAARDQRYGDSQAFYAACRTISILQSSDVGGLVEAARSALRALDHVISRRDTWKEISPALMRLTRDELSTALSRFEGGETPASTMPITHELADEEVKEIKP